MNEAQLPPPPGLSFPRYCTATMWQVSTPELAWEGNNTGVQLKVEGQVGGTATPAY